MKILPPDLVTDGNLTSNVAISETEWTAGTYTTGTLRYVGSDLYEVVADPSTADEPTAGAAKDVPTWIKTGKINKWRMFDQSISDQTTQTGGPIEADVDTVALTNGVALFNVKAATVRVVVTDATDGVVYDKTKSMAADVGVTNWYQYFFAPIVRKSSVFFLDLPAYRGATITVTADDGDNDTAVGELIIGRQRVLGITLMNFTFGIEDFSRKERDEFGRFIIVERKFAKLASFDVFLNNSEVNNTFDVLAQYRAKPAVYIGDDSRPETIIFGFYRSFSTLRTGPITSEMTAEIEGMT